MGRIDEAGTEIVFGKNRSMNDIDCGDGIGFVVRDDDRGAVCCDANTGCGWTNKGLAVEDVTFVTLAIGAATSAQEPLL